MAQWNLDPTHFGVTFAVRHMMVSTVRGRFSDASAQIDIDEPPGRAWCGPCGSEVRIDSRADPCPRCGGYPVRVVGGADLRVVDLLVLEP